jgi:hypothetical protein
MDHHAYFVMMILVESFIELSLIQADRGKIRLFLEAYAKQHDTLQKMNLWCQNLRLILDLSLPL